MAPRLEDIQIVPAGINDPSIFTWPVTSRMGDEAWYHGDDAGTLDCPHSKSGVWPVWMLTPDQPDPTPAEGNVWGIAQVDGVWYARTLHYLRPGQTRKLFPRADWATDREPLGPVPASWPGPQRGDLVGMCVSTRARYGHSQTQERSDVIWTRYGLPGVLEREGVVPPPVEPPPVEPPPPEEPSEVDEPAWVSRLTERLDAVSLALASIAATWPDLLDAVQGVKAEVQRGIKMRWR